ncbi:unnamed protein product [Penicillium pancosmium]
MRPPAPAQPNQAACEEFIIERWGDRLKQNETDSIIHDIRQLISILREWDDLRGSQTGDCYHQKVKKIMDSLQLVWHQVDKCHEGSTGNFQVGSLYFISQVFKIVAWQIARLTLRAYDESDTYAIATTTMLVESPWGYLTGVETEAPP